jgi:hypothetical protein
MIRSKCPRHIRPKTTLATRSPQVGEFMMQSFVGGCPLRGPHSQFSGRSPSLLSPIEASYNPDLRAGDGTQSGWWSRLIARPELAALRQPNGRMGSQERNDRSGQIKIFATARR